MSAQPAMRSGRTGWLYWALAVALVAFGAITMVSIGVPFLGLGLTLMAVAPLRGTPSRFWPPVLAVIAFVAGWWLLGPVACSVESGPMLGQGRMTCESAVGIEYQGNPSWIGPAVGLAAAAVTYVGLHLALRPRNTRS